jgi:hypothetical protein
MTEKSCPIPTPDESRYMAIQQSAEQSMLEKVFQAIEDAAAEVASKVGEAGLELEPASAGYFMFAVQQATFVRLSGGDPDTLEGGDPEIGERIARNCQDIVDHYWRKDRTFTDKA